MSKKNLNEPNPKLEEGDRITVLYVAGEEIPVQSKGIVVGINNQPRFKPTDCGYGYWVEFYDCLLYTSPSPRDGLLSRMPSSA